jgi:hypothetical protein
MRKILAAIMLILPLTVVGVTGCENLMEEDRTAE